MKEATFNAFIDFHLRPLISLYNNGAAYPVRLICRDLTQQYIKVQTENNWQSKEAKTLPYIGFAHWWTVDQEISLDEKNDDVWRAVLPWVFGDDVGGEILDLMASLMTALWSASVARVQYQQAYTAGAEEAIQLTRRTMECLNDGALMALFNRGLFSVWKEKGVRSLSGFKINKDSVPSDFLDYFCRYNNNDPSDPKVVRETMIELMIHDMALELGLGGDLFTLDPLDQENPQTKVTDSGIEYELFNRASPDWVVVHKELIDE